MNFSLLGCGRWGSFIAWYLNKNGNNVTVWGRANCPTFETLIKSRKNEYVEFPEEIEITSDLKKALDHAEYIVISISAQGVRDLMQNVSKIEGYKNKKYIYYGAFSECKSLQRVVFEEGSELKEL